MSVQRCIHITVHQHAVRAGLARAVLQRYPGHAEAVARITWCVDQHASGSSPGKSAPARPSPSARQPQPGPRATRDHLPTEPSFGVRGMPHHIVTALGRVPNFYTVTLAPQAADALAAEHAERGPHPRSWWSTKPHWLDNPQMEAVRMLTNHDMDSGSPFAALLVRQPAGISRNRQNAQHRGDGVPDEDHRLHLPSLQDRRPHRPLILR